MKSTPDEQPIEEAVRLTIESNTEMVERWTLNQAGSWGFLAGRAVTTYRRMLARPLADGERRAVWHLLWTRLEELK